MDINKIGMPSTNRYIVLNILDMEITLHKEIDYAEYVRKSDELTFDIGQLCAIIKEICLYYADNCRR